jgi:hypothetical protein
VSDALTTFSRIGSRLARGRGGWAFAAYLLVSFLFLGLPVVAHPERDVVGGLFTDPQIFVWSFAWWPHAILHGSNPFYTHQIWAPGGFNLAWATSVPALAIAFAPLTLLFGPLFAYNVACIVMPALAAWTAFLLCRRLTRAAWPSLAGGFLFGFSTYVLAAESTHIFTAAVFLLPVIALLVLRFVDGDLSRRGLAIRLGLVLALQMLLSTEILFFSTLALVLGLLLAIVMVPAARRALVGILLPLAGAYALAAVVTAPFGYYVATGFAFKAPPGATAFVADALNLVVPTMATVGGWWSKHLELRWPANDSERGTYLGVPLLAIVALYAWRWRRSPGGRWLVAVFLVAVLAALGSWLTVDGNQLVVLRPWAWLAERPIFKQAMPVRLMVFAALATSVMTAQWAAASTRPAWLRVALPAVAALAIAPNLSWGGWSRTPDVPELFTTSLYKSCIGRGENVLLLPFGTLGDSMMWQARAGFWFRDAGGYISPYPPPSYTWLDGMREVAAEVSPPQVTTNSVLQLVRVQHVTSIVLDAHDEALWGRWLRPFARPQAVGGTLIYRLRGASDLRAACAAAARA